MNNPKSWQQIGMSFLGGTMAGSLAIAMFMQQGNLVQSHKAMDLDPKRWTCTKIVEETVMKPTISGKLVQIRPVVNRSCVEYSKKEN